MFGRILHIHTVFCPHGLALITPRASIAPANREVEAAQYWLEQELTRIAARTSTCPGIWGRPSLIANV
jgi:hypothetical protein